MKTVYLDCASGVSGDMFLGALVDAGVPIEEINAKVASLGLPGLRLAASMVTKKGFRATQITIEHEPEHKHRHLHHIVAMIDGSTLLARQQELARRIFTRLAEAEARVHGTTVEKVHFHEVGAADSIGDIVGAAVGWDLLGAEQMICSPVTVGGGTIEIAHGRCSVPAPATAELLTGIPLAESSVRHELTTPTGAAIVATLAERFGPMPSMTIEQLGVGSGQRDLDEQANVLRMLVGQMETCEGGERVWVLETNLDDVSGELIGYAVSQLWEAGALDVTTSPIQMKKNRPGVKVSVLCQEADVRALEAVLFRETTTLGVRRWSVQRQKLKREGCQVETPWGAVAGVVGSLEGGSSEGRALGFSPEYESCRRLAESNNIPLREVYRVAIEAYHRQATSS